MVTCPLRTESASFFLGKFPIFKNTSPFLRTNLMIAPL
jgi:hypothetical protein